MQQTAQKARELFNASFTAEKYQQFLADINPDYDLAIDFRIAESPVFVIEEFRLQMRYFFEDIKKFLYRSDLKELMKDAVPKEMNIPNESDHPAFVVIDFAICKDENGDLVPQLIELQGIASLYCYQQELNKAYKRHFDIPKELTPFYNGMDEEKYLTLFKKVIIGDANIENVIMLDIEPKKQKTRIDFHYTEKNTGIRPVCVTEVFQEGNEIFYLRDGKKTKIERVYNRIVPDEFLKIKDQLHLRFDILSDLDIEWVAHPNWYYKISKYSMPFMESKFVPKTYFLDQLKEYPKDLENYVLKPLFSFASAGVEFDVTKEILDKVEDKANHILQRKVAYEPFLETPDVPAKAEIRMLCIWDDELVPAINLARLSKGKLIGVDFNKDKEWVGSSAVFFAS